MKESLKKMLNTAGLLAFGYLIGNIKGIADCATSVDDKLEKDHNLSLDRVVWKPTGKITKVEISKINKEEKAEETE